jgi:hypothetical protein
MSTQNDRWITELALHHGMIEPFEHSQVRDVQRGQVHLRAVRDHHERQCRSSRSGKAA